MLSFPLLSQITSPWALLDKTNSDGPRVIASGTITNLGSSTLGPFARLAGERVASKYTGSCTSLTCLLV